MKELQPVINQVIDLIKDTKDFVVSQAPDFIRQFLCYSLAKNAGQLALCVAVLAIIAKVSSFLKNRMNAYNEQEAILGFVILLPLAGIVVFGGVMAINELLMIWLSPKVYLVTHLASLLN